MKKILACTALLSTVFIGGTSYGAELSDIEALGKMLYESTELSLDKTQSCFTCHDSTAGFADPTNNVDPVNYMVSLGDDLISLGGRNAPTSAYCGFSPILHQKVNGEWVGGMFWDGRATGDTLGDPLAEQAQGPPLNPVEMNMADADTVIARISQDTKIAELFEGVFGIDAFANAAEAYDNLARAIAAYERSSEVTRFTSDYDMGVSMTAQEMLGKKLFKQNCTTCHAMGKRGSGHALFTNYGYVNAGVPINTVLEDDIDCAYEYPDLGLGPVVDDPSQNGKFKVPTLRNIAMTAPYSHNGYFATLGDMVSFMNDNSGYEPEVGDNLSTAMGNLGLSAEQVDDIVAFLGTLTDK